MPRLTQKQKSEILTEYVAGKSKSELARKFKVSVTAISKILESVESLKNGKKSLNQRELGNAIISKATESLYVKDFNEMHPETLLKIIERLSLLYKDENGTPNGKRRNKFCSHSVCLTKNGKHFLAFRLNFSQ